MPAKTTDVMAFVHNPGRGAADLVILAAQTSPPSRSPRAPARPDPAGLPRYPASDQQIPPDSGGSRAPAGHDRAPGAGGGRSPSRGEP